MKSSVSVKYCYCSGIKAPSMRNTVKTRYRVAWYVFAERHDVVRMRSIRVCSFLSKNEATLKNSVALKSTNA